MWSGTICGNTASRGNGGGVSVYSGAFTMLEGQICDNTSTYIDGLGGDGGGVYVGYNGTFAISGGKYL
jgi:hypothetical protein